MTTSAYETLYESSIAYGVRKALVAEQKRLDLDLKLKELATAKRDLQQQVENLKKAIEAARQRATEKREIDERVHTEEVIIELRF
jgi:dynein light intermediate chain